MFRQGQMVVAKESVKMVFFVIVLSLVLVVVWQVIGRAVQKDVDVGGLAQVVYRDRLVFGGSCFAWGDGVRVYPGVVDFGRVNESVAARCLDSETFSARVDVYVNGSVKSVVVNEDRYGIDRRLCFSARYECEDHVQFVTVVVGNVSFAGWVNVSGVFYAGV